MMKKSTIGLAAIFGLAAVALAAALSMRPVERPIATLECPVPIRAMVAHFEAAGLEMRVAELINGDRVVGYRFHRMDEDGRDVSSEDVFMEFAPAPISGPALVNGSR